MARVKDNQLLVSLMDLLSRDKKPIWKKVRKELDRPRRNRVEVNLSKLQAYGADNGTVLVPGKVLGAGEISKKLTVAAFSFSDSAKKLITAAGGRIISIEALHKANPEGRDVRILK
ncbi:MAG: 50S ribosomal protein L18e [Candidatus Micrarchaeota archaeon]